MRGVIFMAVIDPGMQDRFQSLSDDLKKEVMKRDVRIRNLQDLIRCLEKIVLES